MNTPTRPKIRLATEADAGETLAVYAPLVRDTAISFELTPPTVEEFRSRIRDTLKLAPWLVCEVDGAVVGYAYASSFRGRPAYRFTVECTAYVHADHRRRHVGRALYTALFDCLRIQGFRRVIGGITLPNEASVALHESVGMKSVGVFAKCGFKFRRWHDVGFWEMPLLEPVPDPAEPRRVAEAAATQEWRDALVRAVSWLRVPE